MAEKRIEHKEPIIRFARCVIRGNSYVSRKARSGDGLFIWENMEQEYLQSYVGSQDYFGTLAAFLTVVRQGVAADFQSPGADKEDCMEMLDDFIGHLLFLQGRYDIVEKKKSR